MGESLRDLVRELNERGDQVEREIRADLARQRTGLETSLHRVRAQRRAGQRHPSDVSRQALVEATERLARSNAERRRQAAESTGVSSRRSQLGSEMPKKYREVRKALKAAGWMRLRQSGSHEVWGKAGEFERIVIAGRDGDTVAPGTLSRIRRISGLKELR